MRPRLALLTSVLMLACSDPPAPVANDTESSTTSSSSSSGTDATSSMSRGSVDTTAGEGSASGEGTTTRGLDDTGSTGPASTGPQESSSSSSSDGGVGPVNGCADGEREALEDEANYPDIAGCSGGWSVPGVLVNNPACNREGGDDGSNPTGVGCSVEDLCSAGWHVCMSRNEVMAAGVDDCNDVGFGGAFFATRQSGNGMDACAAAGVNDVFGCGDIGHTMIVGCAPLNRSTANGCVALPHPWSCNVSLTQEAQFLIKDGPQFGGALCCRD